MDSLSTEIVIEAAPERVWQVLVDTPSYPQWNPFIVACEGRLSAGERITVKLQPPGQGAWTFRPKLIVVNPDQELRWLGSLAVRGLFDGEHTFRLQRLAPNQTLFQHSERFTGWLVPLVMRGGMKQSTSAGFAEMNAALKRRAESMAAGAGAG